MVKLVVQDEEQFPKVRLSKTELKKIYLLVESNGQIYKLTVFEGLPASAKTVEFFWSPLYKTDSSLPGGLSMKDAISRYLRCDQYKIYEVEDIAEITEIVKIVRETKEK